MFFLYVMLSVYICAVNFYAYRLVLSQREEWDDNGEKAKQTDGKIFLAAFLGGAVAIYASMFALKYRLSNILLMIAMPLIALFNLYCFALGYRAIYLFL